jgi:hypothetical protein
MIVMGLKGGRLQEEDPDITLEGFQGDVDKVLDGVRLGTPHWTTSWNIHRRMVSAYLSDSGRVLLAGDAAHINSPAGGMGMNTAIQDGFNVAWKLAMVCKGFAGQEILKTYEKERKPIAKLVSECTDLLHSVIMAHGQKLTDRIERASAESWLERAVLRMSGQAFRYGEGHDEDLIGNAVAIRSGDQAPDILVHDGAPEGLPVRLSAAAAPYFLLLVTDGGAMEAANVAGDRFQEVLTVVTAAAVDSESSKVGGAPGTLEPPSDAVLKAQYGSHVAALIRPDRYVLTLIPPGADLVSTVTDALASLAIRPAPCACVQTAA